MGRLILLVFVVLLYGAYLAIKSLPFWMVAVGAVAGLVLLKFVGGYLLKRLFLIPFKAKGEVMRDASVKIHSISPVPPPPPQAKSEKDEEGENEEAENKLFTHYFSIDVTITPKNTAGPFRSWSPDELELIQFGRKMNPYADESERCDGDVVKVEVFGDGAFHPFDGEKYTDSNRFRLLARTRANLKRASFTYYFQTFGDLNLPQVNAPVKASPPPVPAMAVAQRW